MASPAFLARAIDRLQRMSIEDGLFAVALHEYVARARAMAWDAERGLFWVDHPQSGMQVAVWMMPIAGLVEPVTRSKAP